MDVLARVYPEIFLEGGVEIFFVCTGKFRGGLGFFS